MHTTPVSLLQNLRRQPDAEHWGAFERLYRPWLRGILLRLLPAGEVDDVLQDVFVILVQELPRFEHNGQAGAFRRWLRLIVVNRVREFWRARRQEPPLEADYQARCEQLADEHSELSRRWDREHDQHVIERLLAQVMGDFTPGTWRAFRAFVLEGQTAEVARSQGISEGAVWTAKSRVLQRLRQLAEDFLR